MTGPGAARGAPADTIAAIATASGRGGVAIVRISGPSAHACAARVLNASVPPARRAMPATFHDRDGVALDNGLVLAFAAPRSFTGEDVVELHGHGGAVVSDAVLGAALDAGARLAEPGEFTRRAYLNGKLDLAQAEAVADLVDAASSRAARAALASLRGDFSNAVDAIAKRLLRVRMLVEATLDFADEPVGELDVARVTRELDAVDARLAAAHAAAKTGARLREGASVAIVGAPNAGKSTLLNRLAGHDAAIVSDVPGTTRDTVRASLVVEGMPLELVDTAGLRASDDAIEQLGMERTRAAASEAELVLEVRAVDEPQALRAAVPRARSIVVMNKTDLVGEQPRVERDVHGSPAKVWLSAAQGHGIAGLRDAMAERLGVGGPLGGAQEEGVYLARRRHLDALAATAAGLGRARQALDDADAPELLAEELRVAHAQLGAITGAVTSDDLLGEIFSTFCIGK